MLKFLTVEQLSLRFIFRLICPISRASIYNIFSLDFDVNSARIMSATTRGHITSHKGRIYEGWSRQETVLKRAYERGRTEGEGGSI